MKVITMQVVVSDEMAEATSKMVEQSAIAQQGIYTLDCGSVRELNDEEKQEVEDSVPSEYLD